MTDIPALPGFPVTLLGGKGFLLVGAWVWVARVGDEYLGLWLRQYYK